MHVIQITRAKLQEACVMIKHSVYISVISYKNNHSQTRRLMNYLVYYFIMDDVLTGLSFFLILLFAMKCYSAF